MLALPLVVATAFCFSYVLINQDAGKKASKSTKTDSNSSTKLPEIPIKEQDHLPDIDTSQDTSGETGNYLDRTNTASPQNQARPNDQSQAVSNASPKAHAPKAEHINDTANQVKPRAPMLP